MERYKRLKALRYATIEYFQKGHFDFDQQMYEGLKQRYPEAAEQIKKYCLESLLSSKELDHIENDIELIHQKIETDSNYSPDDAEKEHLLEDSYYEQLKKMDWAILFDINKDGTTNVHPIDVISEDVAVSDPENIAAEYIFHPDPASWINEISADSRQASVDTSWMEEVLKVTKPGVNVETPYGKVFVHPKKGRRYIKKTDGTLESLPRFLLSLDGVDLPKGQDIHHKDENKLNDVVDNYAYDEHHDHAREHMNFKKIKGAEIVLDPLFFENNEELDPEVISNSESSGIQGEGLFYKNFHDLEDIIKKYKG